MLYIRMQTLLTLVALLNSLTLQANGYKVDTVIMASLILNEPREILVYEPDGLKMTDSVTIIYLLDGEFSGYRYDRIAQGQSGKPVIGVGIVNTNRNRDLLPAKAPDKFLNFIDKELIPAVEKNYLLSQRILFGHSFAGGFTLYSMIHKPGLFHRYIASSPTPIMGMVEPSIYLELDSKLPKETELYFSSGSKDMKQVKKWCEILNTNLKTLTFKHIHWESEINAGENHQTNDLASLTKGLGRL
jgi:predicted alpha/beta superfamily hydrolase